MSPSKFTLYYRGSLKSASKSNTRAADKREIRRVFHEQMQTLWSSEPYKDFHGHHFERPKSKYEVGSTTYFPLVTKAASLVAELDITFLRNEEGGRIITSGGDIDNRLKTLFDALRLPHDEKEAGDEAYDDGICYTLLEDDALITSVSVTTDRLLEDCERDDVLLLIRVTVVPINFPLGSFGIA